MDDNPNVGQQLSDAAWAGKGFWAMHHYSPKANRKSIEQDGLKGTSRYGGENKLFVAHKNDIRMVIGSEPNVDIYKARIPNSVESEQEISPFPFIRTNIPAEHVERVGHTNHEGDIHWHKEEDCNGR